MLGTAFISRRRKYQWGNMCSDEYWDWNVNINAKLRVQLLYITLYIKKIR